MPGADSETVTRKVVPSHQWPDEDAHSHPIVDLVRRLFQSDVTLCSIFFKLQKPVFSS